MATTFKFGNGNWAVKDGYALAYNDENNNFKPLPFDFTRASNATRVNKQGLVETVPSGKPRIDFLDNTSGHLLLEPSRTNTITYSEDFSQSVWNQVDVTIDSGYTAPDGTNTAFKVTENGSSAHFYGFSGVNTGKHKSIWAKTVSGTGVIQLLNRHSDTSNIFTITEQWQRFDVAHNENDYFYLCDFRGASTTLTEIILWGAQSETGSYPTSYIPTEGSSVTRSAERNSQGNLSNVLSSSGVLYTEIELGKSTTDTSSSQIRFNLSENGSTANWIFFGIENGDNLRTYVRASASTTTDNTVNGVFPSEGIYKIALRFELNNTKIFVNGVEKYSDTSSIPPSNLNFFQQGAGGPAESANIEEAFKVIETRLYDTALTDTELQNLTS